MKITIKLFALTALVMTGVGCHELETPEVSQMEKEGVVSPADRVGRREILAGNHSV